MKKTFIAALRLPLALLQRMKPGRLGQKEQVARDNEEERLDRIRNPHKYRPNQDD